MNRWKALKIVKMTIFFTLAALLMGGLVMLLWNGLVPELFGGPRLNFGQALGLLILSKILLKGFGWGGWGGGCHHKGHPWKSRFESKMAAMTPEERAKFKEKWGSHCNWHSWPEEDQTKQADNNAAL
ncbi:MAG: hypothetical protein M3Q97_07135 [Bacteroidota bacterium]|nr:hypothetical protein [Bacteroidota bacterium]